MKPVALRASLAVLLLIASGCGDDPSAGFATMGMPGIPSPTRVGANLVFADVTVNGHAGGRLAVDTGSPLMLIDARKFPGLTFPAQNQVTADLGVGAFTVSDIPVMQFQTPDEMDPLNFAGLLGGNVMRQFSVRLDYARPDQAFRLGMPDMEPATDGVETPGTSIAFALEGGGRGTFQGEIVSFPATRIPLTVDIEGVSHPFILDTGASETTIRGSLYAAITADGRSQISGLPIGTVAGHTTAMVTRVRSMTVGDATVANAAVMTIEDTLLDGVESEVHHPVDGLLGGNFLREFMVTVDYPNRTLHLQRYTAAVIVDEFKRVGVELGVGFGAQRYVVGAVYQGTDAMAKQISVGDEIVSVDGQALNGLDSVTADSLLNGTVGATRAVGLGTARAAGLSNTTVVVRIDDLIPAPSL